LGGASVVIASPTGTPVGAAGLFTATGETAGAATAGVNGLADMSFFVVVPPEVDEDDAVAGAAACLAAKRPGIWAAERHCWSISRRTYVWGTIRPSAAIARSWSHVWGPYCCPSTPQYHWSFTEDTSAFKPDAQAKEVIVLRLRFRL
jgi:hypothetical protein